MSETAAAPPPKTWIDRALLAVEKAGNKLPHPGTLFAGLAVLVVIASWIGSKLGLTAVHPATGKTIEVMNLLSIEGLHRMLTQTVSNFTGFAPLGTVLVAMIGIGVAEGSGLLATALRRLVLAAPRRMLTVIVVFAGVMSNAAGEIGYVVLVPLAALLFKAAGRHPVLGLAAGFAGVSGGYSANLLLGTVDPLLAGLTQEAARILEPGYVVSPAANYYFLAVSTFLITALGTWVTERVIAPRLGAWSGEEDGSSDAITDLTAAERRGLRFAGLAVAGVVALVLIGIVPESGFLREAGTGSVLNSPLLKGIVTLIFVGGATAGIAYGVGAGTIRNDADVMKTMGKALETLGTYLVLVFFAAQFVAFFNWSNLGLLVAVNGANFLKSVGLPEIPLFLAFIVLSAVINLFMGSASAKWAVMAPVFVPMLMLLGYSPEVTQAAYRVGDSVTNIISPTMTYFALIIAFLQRYQPKAGIGTLVATMLPYTVTFLIGWSLLFLGWIALDLPFGPGAPLQYLPAPAAAP
jgi:aminobenzoyl-glutamate transport protein